MLNLDHWSPWRVHPDGTATQARVLHYPETVQGQEDDDYSELAPWRPVTGYSNQHRYSGPVMHNSEQLGGGMLTDTLETTGTYVCAPVQWEDGELEGWMLLRLTD